MTRPITTSVADALYEALLPLAEIGPTPDGEPFWELLNFCQALANMFQPVYDVVRDTPDQPGWTTITNPDTVPIEGLVWLAQIAGVKLRPGLSDAAQRQRVKETGGWQRGTPDALKGAARPYLSGSQSVVLRERDPVASPKDPSAGITVIVYKNQAPPDIVATQWGAPYNWVRNPDFELDLAHTNSFSGGATTAFSLSRVSGAGRDGVGFAARLQGTGGATLSYMSLMTVTTFNLAGMVDALPVVPGQIVFFGASFKINSITAGTPPSFHYGIAWYDATGANLGISYVTDATITSPTTGTWYDRSSSAVAPAGAAYAVLRLNAGDSGNTIPNGSVVTMDVDNVWMSATNAGFFTGDSLGGYTWEGTAHSSRSMSPIRWDSPSIRASLIEQKPAGDILNFYVINGIDYFTLRSRGLTYAQLRSTYSTYTGLRNDVPGT